MAARPGDPPAIGGDDASGARGGESGEIGRTSLSRARDGENESRAAGHGKHDGSGGRADLRPGTPNHPRPDPLLGGGGGGIHVASSTAEMEAVQAGKNLFLISSNPLAIPRATPVTAPRRRSTSPPPFVVLPPRRLVNRSACGADKRAHLVSRYKAVSGVCLPAFSHATRAGDKARNRKPAPIIPRADPKTSRVSRRPQRRHPSPPSLVWVRRDKFVSGNFTADDCFSVGPADHLVAPKNSVFREIFGLGVREDPRLLL